MQTKEQLQKTIDYALKRAEIYRTTKDGSYGAALDAYGYFAALKELTKINETNEKKGKK